MKKDIKRKTACMTAVFFTILAGITILFLVKLQKQEESQFYQEQMIALNEIEKLTEVDGKSPAKEQIAAMQEKLQQTTGEGASRREEQEIILKMAAVCGVFVLLVFFYIYRVMLRPFEKLEKYAGEIAKGNLDVELPYERTNLFGAFTWAFDHMRREIQKARSCEREAIENNKTVIATLSHDIKTPIASIRAYTEGLEANMDSSPERRQRYISVIIKKCDEVTKLTNDLFLHSLSDLEKLQMNLESVELSGFLLEVLEGIGQQTDAKQEIEGQGAKQQAESHQSQTADLQEDVQPDIVQIAGELPPVSIQADRKRLEQVLENIITNARKYAPGTGICLWAEALEDAEAGKNREWENERHRNSPKCRIHIKDGGTGILPEDMPFVLEKFYRGKNVKAQPGAGLGLYIVDYIMKQMGGLVELKNSSTGLEVILELDIITTFTSSSKENRPASE